MHGFPFSSFFDGGRAFQGEDSDDEAMDELDLYKVLGVGRNASKNEIRKAFKQLAKQHHPDRGGDEEKFKEIRMAYEILSDEQKRNIYDRRGLRGLKQGGMGGGGDGIHDFLVEMFGGHGRRSGKRERPKNAPIKEELWLVLEDVYRGPVATLEIKYETAESGGICNRCDGAGIVLESMKQGMMILQHQISCPDCYGKGSIFKKKRTKKKKIKVHVPKGVQNNYTITVEGEGHSLPGKLPGDVEVNVKIKHHQVFTRMGADLCCEKPVNVKDALCGFTCEFEHVSGTILKYVCKDGVQHDQVKRFKGWGLPQLGGHLGMVGNLFVKFTVVFPVPGSISEDSTMNELKEILQKLTYVEQKKQKKQDFGVGTRIQLCDLQNYKELNGKSGTVVSQTNRGWAVKLDDSTGKLLSVPRSKLKIYEPKHGNTNAKTKQFQAENDYEEEIYGTWVKSESDLEVTPAVASGSAFDRDEELKSSRMKGEACQHQ